MERRHALRSYWIEEHDGWEKSRDGDVVVVDGDDARSSTGRSGEGGELRG